MLLHDQELQRQQVFNKTFVRSPDKLRIVQGGNPSRKPASRQSHARQCTPTAKAYNTPLSSVTGRSQESESTAQSPPPPRATPCRGSVPGHRHGGAVLVLQDLLQQVQLRLGELRAVRPNHDGPVQHRGPAAALRRLLLLLLLRLGLHLLSWRLMPLLRAGLVVLLVVVLLLLLGRGGGGSLQLQLLLLLLGEQQRLLQLLRLQHLRLLLLLLLCGQRHNARLQLLQGSSPIREVAVLVGQLRSVLLLLLLLLAHQGHVDGHGLVLLLQLLQLLQLERLGHGGRQG